jgi:exodeoxyribonuclease V alpha subunit
MSSHPARCEWCASPKYSGRRRKSQIIVNAHRINHGVMPDLRKPEAESDFYFVEAEDPETAVPRIVELVKTRIPRRFGLDPIRDVQVLCPMNRGGVGARSLNIELRPH